MFKNFKANISLRILLLIGLVLAFVFLMNYTQFYITLVALGLLIMLTIWDLIRYTEQTNRDITAFLMGIKYNDFSVSFTGKHKGRSFGELYESFNQINEKFREIQAEKEAQFQYLQTIVETVNVGLLCFDKEGEILLINKALKMLLQKPYLVSAQSLQQVDQRLYEKVQEMETGDKELIKINIGNRLHQLSVQANEFKLRDSYYKLIAMQNIHSELEEQELSAWQKLIRILTHEIMNSVTPIVSLTSAIDDLLEQRDELTGEELTDFKNAIEAIQKRSEGLLHFTETYRSLTKIPTPKIQIVDGRMLIERLLALFKPSLNEKKITLRKFLPKTEIYLQADPELIEQVFINLLKNAIEAVREVPEPQISIHLLKDQKNNIVMQVSDNGPGIGPELLDQIFVPFFTTKKEGSGIGLSLSRQIIRMHKGSLDVHSVVGEGTVFTITL